MLNQVLKDDSSATGGIVHVNETLIEFLESIDREDLITKVNETEAEINALLNESGIKPIKL